MKNLSLLQEALFTIKKLKKELNDKATQFEPVAIVGLSCRFPQVPNKNVFWELLEKGKNIISKLPEERLALLKASQEYLTLRNDFPYWGGYLANIELFDSYFFGISPREALLIDPQQRFLLEVAYEAIEDAGLNMDRLAGSNTGVFIGMYPSEYLAMQSVWTDLDALYLPTGNATSIAANRLSYQFDLQGPSFTVDTACSSSLVAAHLACNAIRNRECDIAILGSVRINLLPSINYTLARAKMLSPDGQCKTFDADANGYVQGEGGGVLILKSLAKALEDKDQIYAVIEGSVINQDGRTNGLTAPNGASQEALLKAAYSISRIDPAQVGYIECHGTGTPLGDPIEVEALENVIGKAHQEEHCWMGSLKTNIGHLEPAAGIASLIKVALALQRGKIPPHLNFAKPNPHIPFEKYHFKIPQQVEDWPLHGDYHVAGISSFGFGGTNGHIVIRSLKEKEKHAYKKDNPFREAKTEIFTLSAKDLIALEQLICRWCDALEEGIYIDLSQLCYNVHLRRSHYSYRLAIVTETIDGLYNALCALRENARENFLNIFIYSEKDKYKTLSPLDRNEPQKLDLVVLAKLYVNGEPIDWIEYEKLRNYPYLEMPLYPWQHKAYWPKITDNSENLNPRFMADPLTKVEGESYETYLLRGKQVNTELKNIFQFEFVFDINELPELSDTRNILHIGYYLEMLSFVALKTMKQHHLNVKNLDFLLPIHIPVDESVVRVHLILEKNNDNESFFRFQKLDKSGAVSNTIYAEGALSWKVDPISQLESLSDIKRSCTIESGNVDSFSDRIKAMNMPIQSSIQWTESYCLSKKCVVAKFRQPLLQERADSFALKVHPGLFDGCVQPLFMLLNKEIMAPYITSKIKGFQYFGMRKQGELFLVARVKKIEQEAKSLFGEWYLVDTSGNVLAFCRGIELTQLDSQVVSTAILEKSSLDKKWDTFDKIDMLIDFLKEQISYVFNIPINDVSNEKTLWDMGMNSLMAVFLAERIEEKVGISFSVEKLLSPINIKQISEFLFDSLQQKLLQKKQSNVNALKQSYANISYVVRRSDPKIRLFCFPYGGAGASIYKDWHRYFSDDVEIFPIQLPGRETLYDMKFSSSMQELVQFLYSNIVEELTLPFAFFGHSFGSLIAFELVRYLRNHKLFLPEHLFVSAYPAPHLPKTSLGKIISCLKKLPYDVWSIDPNKLTDDRIDMLVSQLSEIIKIDQSFSKIWVLAFLPRYLNDMHLVKEYCYSPEVPLNVPMTVFYGSQDELIKKEDSLLWDAHTNQACQAIEVKGGHLFIDEKEGKEEVLGVMRETLSRIVSLQDKTLALEPL